MGNAIPWLVVLSAIGKKAEQTMKDQASRQNFSIVFASVPALGSFSFCIPVLASWMMDNKLQDEINTFLCNLFLFIVILQK